MPIELEIEPLRAAVELAKAARARARDPGASQMPHDHLPWQLDQLQSNVLRLRIRAENAGDAHLPASQMAGI